MAKYLDYSGLVTVLTKLKDQITSVATSAAQEVVSKLTVFGSSADGLVPKTGSATDNAVLTAAGTWQALSAIQGIESIPTGDGTEASNAETLRYAFSNSGYTISW